MTNEEAIARIADHMVTHKIGSFPHIKIAEALNFAIEILEKVRDGKMIELPCRVGDVIYYVEPEFDEALRNFVPKIKSTQIARITFEYANFYECLNGRAFFDDHIGKDIFLTREEAEKALKAR